MARNGGIEVQLERIIDDYSEELREKVEDAVDKAAKQCKRDVQAASPVRTGEYKKGWAIRKSKDQHAIGATVYNKAKPGLTHVLEKSHVIRNAYGTYSRTGPGHGQVEHIGPAAEAAEKLMVELIEK